MVGSPKLNRELNQFLPNVFTPAVKSFIVVVQDDIPPVFVKISPAPLPSAVSTARAVVAFFAFCATVPAAPCIEDVNDENRDGFAAPDAAAAGFTLDMNDENRDGVAAPDAAGFALDINDEKRDGFAGSVAAGLLPNPKLENILILLSSQILRNKL